MGEKKERDEVLDYLRAIGTVLVIFAHITAPTGILEIRTFDMTMLVFVSGASYALSNREKQTLQIQDYLAYIFNRFKRLIVPTWIFLTLYFAFFRLLTFCGIASVRFSLKDYVGSYFLVSGIGFVWVIRVYFLMAIIAPILLFTIRKLKRSTFCVLLIFAAVVQSVLVEFLKVENGAFWKIVELIIPYMIGYGRCADLTLADFWGINFVAPEMNDNKGVSLLIIRSQRGQSLFDTIQEKLSGCWLRPSPSHAPSV